MAKEAVTIKLDPEIKKKLEERAIRLGQTVSSCASEIIREALQGEAKLNDLVRNIHNECIQIEGMLSIMQGYNTKVYQTILGRTTPEISSEAARLKATDNKKRAALALREMLSGAASDVIDGENVWGEVNKDNIGEKPDEQYRK